METGSVVKKTRNPTDQDVMSLAKALSDAGVEYVVIGGAAMALHGFPRMTKDIDLLLPVSVENNDRLMRALEMLDIAGEGLGAINREWLDKGHSTAVSGEVCIDLLYVAADLKFADFIDHISTVKFKGVAIATLDLDGMLMSKKTTREEDIPDRNKLRRLKNAVLGSALQTQRQIRVEGMPILEKSSGFDCM